MSASLPLTDPAPGAAPSYPMTATERRASASLASIFALRMLGLFLVLPVFALEAAKYPGGDDPARVGLAMGIYGLVQAMLQIPFGMAADRLGRKKVIIFGLLLFAAGSFVAAFAADLTWLVIGRALQGSGAISAAVTALLADQTRDEVRTKAMGLVGGSIGLMFALSLVLSPLLNTHIGLNGLFSLTGILALLGIAIVLWLVPPESAQHKDMKRKGLLTVLKNRELLGLNFGVFVLNAVQLAMWVAVPALLVKAGLPKAQHWHVYLPAVLASFIVMGTALFPLERKGYLRAVLLASIALLGVVQLMFLLFVSAQTGLDTSQTAQLVLGFLLLLFFCSFNVLESGQPSLVSRMAPASSRGAALGLYNTSQSLGLFTGGALGGLMLKWSGEQGLFMATTALSLVWLLLAWRGLPAKPAKT